VSRLMVLQPYYVTQGLSSRPRLFVSCLRRVREALFEQQTRDEEPSLRKETHELA
jgi:hypothetical protein